MFVDESGRFQHPNAGSRFYIIGMVFHDQGLDISQAIQDFKRSILGLGLDPDAFVFHAGPQLDEFIGTHLHLLNGVAKVKVYYDYGQSPVTKILQKSFMALGEKVEFAAEVQPRRYMLFQLADLICSLFLVSAKIKSGERLTESEHRFFGGPSAFRRAEAKFLAAHALA